MLTVAGAITRDRHSFKFVIIQLYTSFIENLGEKRSPLLLFLSLFRRKILHLQRESENTNRSVTTVPFTQLAIT
jgi:hypothetical protein